MSNVHILGTREYYQEEIRQAGIRKRILYNALENLFSKGDPDDDFKDEIIERINGINNAIYYYQTELKTARSEKGCV